MMGLASNHAMAWEIAKRKHHAAENLRQGLSKTTSRDPIENTSLEEREQLYIMKRKHKTRTSWVAALAVLQLFVQKPDRDNSYSCVCNMAKTS